MAKIKANKRNYRKGYHRHIHTYRKLDESHKYSKLLLLFYSIECGLKCLLMEKWNIMSINEIDHDAEKLDIMNTHNISKILKALGYQGMIHFPNIQTCHNDYANVETYHQVWRYGITIEEKDLSKEIGIEKNFNELSRWIDERM